MQLKIMPILLKYIERGKSLMHGTSCVFSEKSGDK